MMMNESGGERNEDSSVGDDIHESSQRIEALNYLLPALAYAAPQEGQLNRYMNAMTMPERLAIQASNTSRSPFPFLSVGDSIDFSHDNRIRTRSSNFSLSQGGYRSLTLPENSSFTVMERQQQLARFSALSNRNQHQEILPQISPLLRQLPSENTVLVPGISGGMDPTRSTYPLQTPFLQPSPTNDLLVGARGQPSTAAMSPLTSFNVSEARLPTFGFSDAAYVQLSRMQEPNIGSREALLRQTLRGDDSERLRIHPKRVDRRAVSLPKPKEKRNIEEKRAPIEPFPEKLHRMLLEVAEDGNADIISFTADGSAFQIHKPDDFFSKVVPKYFKQTRLSSFKRQLNLYGFETTSSGPTKGAYFHKNFSRDKPELCKEMRRRDIKLDSRQTKRGRAVKDAPTAPDFYNMPPITSSAEAKSRYDNPDNPRKSS